VTAVDALQVVGFVGLVCVVVSGGVGVAVGWFELARWRRRRRARRARLAVRERRRLVASDGGRARGLAGPAEWGWPPRS
jgi:hypothetical protein